MIKIFHYRRKKYIENLPVADGNLRIVMSYFKMVMYIGLVEINTSEIIFFNIFFIIIFFN